MALNRQGLVWRVWRPRFRVDTPLGKHPQDYVPNRAIVAWPFTDLSDGRLRVGRRLIVLRQADRPPIKIGLRHVEGWAAYFLDDHLFMKSVPFIEGETYPDLGSNFEAFTHSEFLELETLDPLKRISAGETIVHQETWGGANVPAPDMQGGRGTLARWRNTKSNC